MGKKRKRSKQAAAGDPAPAAAAAAPSSSAAAHPPSGSDDDEVDEGPPAAEEVEYVDSIKEDVRWLGFDWGDREFYASNYFDRLYDFAVGLIKAGKAYVCELSMDEFGKEYRGAPTSPGRESPFRNRSSEENLDLFKRMKAGEFDDGARVLRWWIWARWVWLGGVSPPLLKLLVLMLVPLFPRVMGVGTIVRLC